MRQNNESMRMRNVIRTIVGCTQRIAFFWLPIVFHFKKFSYTEWKKDVLREQSMDNQSA